MSFRLLVAGPETRLPISLQGGHEWVVGRAQDADIQIDDPLVSRRHALLWIAGGRLHVRDIAARNSTRVNGQELSGEIELRVGDRLLFGSTFAEVHKPDELRARVLRGPNAIDETLYISRLDNETADDTLRVLDELATSLSPVTRGEDAAQLALGFFFREFPIQRALVARIGAHDSLRVIASASEDKGGDPIEVTRRMLSLLREERAPVCVRDLSRKTEGDAGEASQVVEIAAPLITRGRLTGLLYLERDPRSACSQNELERIRSLSRILASRLETLDLLERLQDENVELKRDARASANFLGNTKAISALKERARNHNLRTLGIAICGERGSGKRAFAQWMHNAHESDEEDARLRGFVSIDCATLQGKQEEELFGTMETDAARQSLLVKAQHGTLCLRNVLELDLTVQDEVARLYHAGQISRDGIHEALEYNIIVTHCGTAHELRAGLSARLSELISPDAYEIPPLRQRLEDLPLLTAFFLEEIAIELGASRCTVSPRAMDRLRTHDWAGNVAELRQTLQTAAILAGGKPITPKHLPKALGSEPASVRSVELPTLEDIERKHIRHVLEAVGGNKLLASKTLGIANSTLYQKMKKYEIGG